MAGGKGTRLRPITCNIPKPMVPILGKPVMSYSIELLKKYNINDIAVTMAYLPNVIIEYFNEGKEYGVNLKYYNEITPLGTGGSVLNAKDFLDETFIVISGDALTDIDINRAIEFHKESNSKVTLILKKESIPLEYGVVITEENGRIIRFLEKPSWGEVFSNTVNTGIYIIEPEILNYYNKGDNFDFSKDLFPKLLNDGIPMYGYVTDKYWNDIGDLNSYMQTQFDLLNRLVDYKIECNEIQTSVWIGEGTKIGQNVKLTPPIYIDRNCNIKDNVDIRPNTIIDRNCNIEEGVVLKKSIIFKNSSIGKETHISGATICSNVQIKNNVNIYERSVVGKGTIISNKVVVKPDIKIWPEKKIVENSIVNQNLIWGTKVSKTIFGYKDVSGDINIDITPEFASRLGSAYASILNSDNDIIVVSSDNNNASDIVKNSIISGILSTGIGVIQIKDCTVPMNRFAVRFYDAEAGIHIRIDEDFTNKVHIEFIGKNGVNIDRSIERKIENLFNMDDFHRCNSQMVKNIVDVDKFSLLYFQSGSKIIENISNVKRRNPKIVIASSNRQVLELASKYLAYIGCDVVFEYNQNKEYMSEILSDSISEKVKINKAELGILFNSDGEQFLLIDENGNLINNDKYLGLSTLILLKLNITKKIVVPYTAPKIIEKIVEKYNADVIRTKISPASIMNEMLKENSEDNKLIQYILHYDAIWATGKIIDFIVNNNIKLSDLIKEIPLFYMVKKEVNCDWKDKGRVIKEMIEHHKHKTMELFEGVKINNEKGWALIFPDCEKPVCNIYTEGYCEEYAQELSALFSKKVENILSYNIKNNKNY